MSKMLNILLKIEKQKLHILEKLHNGFQVLGADGAIPEDAAKDLILQVTFKC